MLAGTGVTNTGPSVLNGDLDTYPTPAVTGFAPGVTMGTKHAADAVALAAQNDLTTAYNAAAAAPSTSNVTGVDLGGKTLTPGVYTAAAGMALTGTVPLTLTGTADSVFIFQAGSTLITGANSSVVLAGGVQASNVFWQVGSSATLGTGTAFKGNILALTSITLTTGASVDGRALARNGAVTLDSNVFGSLRRRPRRRPVNLGTAAAASVLAGTGVTNTGPSVLNGDLDTYPTPAVTGFAPGVTMGTQHAADAVALAAQNDLTTAYNAAAAAPSTSNVTGVDLGGKTLTPGVYTAAAGDGADRTGAADADRYRRLGVHLPGGQHPHHRREQLGGPVRRRAGEQRVLAGRLVGHPRDRDRLHGQHPGLDLDHADHRCVG